MQTNEKWNQIQTDHPNQMLLLLKKTILFNEFVPKTGFRNSPLKKVINFTQQFSSVFFSTRVAARRFRPLIRARDNMFKNYKTNTNSSSNNDKVNS